MNSVERVYTALKLGQPDRVPVIEFVVDEKVARAAVPGCRDVADCLDRLDLDGVGCFSPNYQTFFHGHIAEILVFARPLTPDERFRVLAYLTGKWEL